MTGDGVSDLLEQVKDLRRKALRDGLDQLKALIRLPVDEWEANEATRVAVLKERVAGLSVQLPLDSSSDSIKFALEYIQGIIVDHSWQEYENEGHEAKAASVSHLQDAYAMVKRREEAQKAAELEAAKAEQEEIKRQQQKEEARQAAEREEIARQIRLKQDQDHQAKIRQEIFTYIDGLSYVEITNALMCNVVPHVRMED